MPYEVTERNNSVIKCFKNLSLINLKRQRESLQSPCAVHRGLIIGIQYLLL